MRILDRLRAFFEAPLRYIWVYLLLPTLFAIDPGITWREYPASWIAHFAIVTCIYLPIMLSYQHAFERVRLSDPFTLRALPFHVVVIFGGVLLGVQVGTWLAAPVLTPDRLAETREVMLAANLVGAPLGVGGTLLYERYRDRLEEARTRELRAQREALAAQVEALQARIQPHFLFNSLNAVAGLIAEDPPRAERAVEKLAELFRYALDASKHPFVPLAEELASVEGFLELERLRFPERLRTAVRVEPGLGDARVPPLFLQPLVENAVQHGVSPRREGGRVELAIARVDDGVEVRVEDDGPGPGRSAHRGAGTALVDLEKRLGLLYGDRAWLRVDGGTLGGCRVTLRLPLVPGDGVPPEDA